jgi:hypothetical protein
MKVIYIRKSKALGPGDVRFNIMVPSFLSHLQFRPVIYSELICCMNKLRVHGTTSKLISVK